MRKTKESGITLIALIITIIVMLILVGVTVTVALNGGLFTTSKEATNKTQLEADRETLQAAVVGAINKDTMKIEKTIDLQNNLPSDWNVTGVDGGAYTATSPKQNMFIVDKNGNIEIADEDLPLLQKYFLGKNEEKDFDEFLDSDGKFKNDEETIKDANLSLTILKGMTSENKFNAYVEYNKKIYKISGESIEGESPYNDLELARNVELIYEPQGREGETVQYDSNNDGVKEDWVILYDNGSNVEMVSKTTMGELTLGANDEQAQTPGDIDKDGSSDTDIDKAIYSYNNAITRLNNYCASLITNENKISVRSVGSNPDDPFSDNSSYYTSENLANWEDGKYNGIVKSSDTNFEQDEVRMIYHGCADKGSAYWFASRIIRCKYSYDYFYVYFRGEYSYNLDTLLGMENREQPTAFGRSYSKAVCPVVKISSDQI